MTPDPRRSGFTLIELLVVITIIVVLLALLTPALDRAIGHAELATCMTHVNLISKGTFMYSQDHRRRYPRLERGMPAGRPEEGGMVVPPGRYGTYTWMDEIRDLGYVSSPNTFDCPTADLPANNLPGSQLGIGINHTQLTPYAPATMRRNQIKQPGRTVLFADSGRISLSTYTNSDPDEWREDPGFQLHYFLTPNHVHHHTPPNDDILSGRQRRMFNRHLGGELASTGHPDGHAEAMRTSEVGFQFWPGAGGEDGTTSGDARWLWDQY